MKQITQNQFVFVFGLCIFMSGCEMNSPPGGREIEENDSQSEASHKPDKPAHSMKSDSFNGLSPRNAFNHWNYLNSRPDLGKTNKEGISGFLIVSNATPEFLDQPLRFERGNFSKLEILKEICAKSNYALLYINDYYIVTPSIENSMKESLESDQLDKFSSIMLSRIDVESITAISIIKYLNERLEGHESGVRIKSRIPDDGGLFSVQLKSIKLVKFINVFAEVSKLEVTVAGDLIVLTAKEQ